jgi:general secretion pathway protein G
MSNRGFTLLEMAIAMAIIATLAAVLAPRIGDYIMEARIARASADAHAIADAIGNFNKTTGKWPIFQSGANITSTSLIYTVLHSPTATGQTPICSASSCLSCNCALWNSASRADISAILERNTPVYPTAGKFAWKGPYVTSLGADPWGNLYVVNADSLKFSVNRAGFVLSAGPNAIIETRFDQDIGSGSAPFSAGGDDIVARFR